MLKVPIKALNTTTNNLIFTNEEGKTYCITLFNYTVFAFVNYNVNKIESFKMLSFDINNY